MAVIKDEGNVDTCPITKEIWDARAAARKADCGGDSVYHCLADREGRKWEKCVQRSLIKDGHCPIFTRSGYIDWKTCNTSDPACPNSSFRSDQVYKYSVCFGNNTPTYTHNYFNEEVDPPLDLIIGVPASILLIIAAILTFVIIYYLRTRKSQGFKEELIKLLPDGLSDEVVREEYVLNGLTTLLREDVKTLAILGKFGNSVSSTSRLILSKYAERMKWKPHQCRFNDLPDTVEDDTIIFVYGWFGLWNDDLSSIEKIQTACQTLEEILLKTNTVKVIVGMRSDLRKKYHVHLEEFIGLFHHEINLDSENVHNDAKFLKYFKEKIKEPCNDINCECKHLTFHMLREGRDKDVGMPLKMNIIANYHGLVSDYTKNKDILKAMTDHITALGENSEMTFVYEWIKYICLKGKFSRSDQFDERLAADTGLEISRDCFDENDIDLKTYVRMRYSDQQNKVSSDEAQYVFWHPFIYICAFHSLFKKEKEIVINRCNVDAILQLVRPRGFKTSYIEVAADDHSVNLFNERLHQLDLVERYKDHPLVKCSVNAH